MTPLVGMRVGLQGPVLALVQLDPIKARHGDQFLVDNNRGGVNGRCWPAPPGLSRSRDGYW